MTTQNVLYARQLARSIVVALSRIKTNSELQDDGYLDEKVVRLYKLTRKRRKR